jgi:hypothetical protein
VHREDELLFAYNYPFSSEAKRIIEQESEYAQEKQHIFLGLAKARVEEAINSGGIKYQKIKYGKLDNLIGYAYARLLVSVIGNHGFVRKYAAAEAQRCREALGSDSIENSVKVANALGINIDENENYFVVKFDLFIRLSSGKPGMHLTNFRLNKGFVFLDRQHLPLLLETAVEKEILKGLPIKISEIPKNILSFAKDIELPPLPEKIWKATGSVSWIEVLLSTPIPDVRHRVVNLILAPYLVNVKGLTEDAAFKIISDYIDKCKELDPNTLINESYIKYQCRYAKRRGLKPLSLRKAKDILGEFLKIDDMDGEKK